MLLQSRERKKSKKKKEKKITRITYIKKNNYDEKYGICRNSVLVWSKME